MLKGALNNRLFRLLVPALLLSGQALACPKVNGVPDYNCSGSVHVTVFGDSIAYGIGDTQNGNKGGYVKRAAAKLPLLQFSNHGEPGQFSRELVRQIDSIFRHGSDPEIKSDLLDSDIVILDLGRNDRWLFGFPSATWRNLKRVADRIRKEVQQSEGAAPLVVISVLMLPNRGSQGPWVKELNAVILQGHKLTNPSDLRFDLVSKRLLSSDQIHPTSEGYRQLAKTLTSYLTKRVPVLVNQLRPDSDNDQIYDLLESVKFGTNPSSADTDGDGKLDGEEVFILKTDPLSAD